jgi:hypothetical protein
MDNPADFLNFLAAVGGLVILALLLGWGAMHSRFHRKDGASIAPGGEVGHSYAANKPALDAGADRTLER